MATMQLDRNGEIFVLTLTNGDGDNTFTPEVMREYDVVLDQLTAHVGNTALLVTADHEKTFCNGINLKWFQNATPDQLYGMLERIARIASRFALLDMPTVVAINGNCYAGGAVLATSFDFRYMRSDRGRFCFSEVNVPVAFTESLTDVIRLLPNPHALNEMVLTGVAFNAKECLERQVVDAIYPQEELYAKAEERALHLANKDRRVYGEIKRQLRRNLIRWVG